MNKICVWCKKPIKEGEKFNKLLGSYSHADCDDKYFKKQEKNIKYCDKKIGGLNDL